MLNQPFEKSGIELFLNSMMQGGLAFLILIIDVCAFHREEFGGFEFLPAPTGEKRCDADDDIDLCTCADQEIEIFGVVPPAGSKSPHPGAAVTFAPRLRRSLTSVGFLPRATAKKSAVHASRPTGSSIANPRSSRKFTMRADVDSGTFSFSQDTEQARWSRLSPCRSVVASSDGLVFRRFFVDSRSRFFTASINRVFDIDQCRYFLAGMWIVPRPIRPLLFALRFHDERL